MHGALKDDKSNNLIIHVLLNTCDAHGLCYDINYITYIDYINKYNIFNSSCKYVHHCTVIVHYVCGLDVRSTSKESVGSF